MVADRTARGASWRVHAGSRFALMVLRRVQVTAACCGRVAYGGVEARLWFSRRASAMCAATPDGVSQDAKQRK